MRCFFIHQKSFLLHDFNTTPTTPITTFFIALTTTLKTTLMTTVVVKEEGSLARQSTDDAADVQFSTHDDARDWCWRLGGGRFFFLRVVVVYVA